MKFPVVDCDERLVVPVNIRIANDSVLNNYRLNVIDRLGVQWCSDLSGYIIFY